jgi:hypothetical protein
LLDTHAARLLDEGIPGSYPRSLAAATRLTAERLEAADPAAADLAELCAFLGPEPIPEDLFTAAAGELDDELAARAADPLAWRQTLGHLTRRSLARIDRRGLAMHRLTQAILRVRLTAAEAVTSRRRAGLNARTRRSKVAARTPAALTDLGRIQPATSGAVSPESHAQIEVSSISGRPTRRRASLR